MRSIRIGLWPALCCLAIVPAAAGAAELADLAARIDYGFYAEEPRVIAAAREELGRLAERDAWARYYRALASWRLAALENDGSRARSLLAECSRSVPADDDATAAAAEAWVLVAACASAVARAEPARGVLQQRRAGQALERAAAIDPTNPRLALVRALHEVDAASERAAPDLAGPALAAAVRAFEEHRARDVAPEWGLADALALLARVRLAEGRLQAARDLVERALLIAPDYRLALRLRERIAGR